MTTRPPFLPSDDASRTLTAIVESLEDAIIGEDVNGAIVAWNRGAERMFGHTAPEAIGRSIAMLMPDARPHELDRMIERIRAGERIERHETVWRAKGGGPVHVSLTVSPIEDAAGRVTGAWTIARDITERKRGERALGASVERWRSIIESAVDGIIVIDARGTIEAFNPAAERLFGYAEAEVLGSNVSILMPAPYRDEHEGYIARYLATGVPKIIGIGREVTALRKDGSTFPVHLAVGRMTIDAQPKFTGILHDLTDRVQMEARLREQSALTRLGEMAAVVAHEVKNPLTGVRGAIQVIGGRLPAGSKDAEIVKEIVARLDALNEMMKDLLLFARPPQPKLAPVDALALLETVAGNVRQDPALKDLQIRVAGAPARIVADAELLKIVVQNLLLNSAHAMHGRGAVEMSVACAGDACRIVVADNGPGIPPDVRTKLFTPFFTTKARGTGLGLSTSRRLVEAHGGTIGIECPAGGGTVVTVQLPSQSG